LGAKGGGGGGYGWIDVYVMAVIAQASGSESQFFKAMQFPAKESVPYSIK
jgi:hypothetical protein